MVFVAVCFVFCSVFYLELAVAANYRYLIYTRGRGRKHTSPSFSFPLSNVRLRDLLLLYFRSCNSCSSLIFLILAVECQLKVLVQIHIFICQSAWMLLLVEKKKCIPHLHLEEFFFYLAKHEPVEVEKIRPKSTCS